VKEQHHQITESLQGLGQYIR